MKKLLSTLLAVLLAVTMLTGMAIPAQAAENDIFNPGVLELDGSRTFTISKTKSSAFFSFHRKPRDATNSVFKIGN